MDIGKFYFLSNAYLEVFNDSYLMKNSEEINGVEHNRPCFFAFQDFNTMLYWVIPISSRTKKFEKIYNDKVKRNAYCDTIAFGEVLGHRKAFLIQNMCPILPKFVENEYLDPLSLQAVRLNGVTERELISKAKKVLVLHRKGIKLIFPDVLAIEKQLLQSIYYD